MLTGRYKFLLILVMPLLVAVNTRAVLNNYQGEINYDPGPPVPAGEPVDMSTGNNMVHEEGLRLAAPGTPLSFDLNYTSDHSKTWIGMFENESAFGIGWDFSLNWRLSVVYKAGYLKSKTVMMQQYGSALAKYMLSDGELITALAEGVDLDQIDPLNRCLFLTKWFLISDGARTYRMEIGTHRWQGGPKLTDWDLNGGCYTESPMDWFLVVTNNECQLWYPVND